MHDETRGTNQVANEVRVQQLIAQWEGLLDQGERPVNRMVQFTVAFAC